MAISIIIPTLNEEAQIGATLAALRPCAANYGAEIIVVDGGSVDRTLEIARRFDFARVVEFNLAHRGLQMNEGARSAIGDALLFLHADAVAPAGALDAINSALSNERLLGGCFR